MTYIYHREVLNVIIYRSILLLFLTKTGTKSISHYFKSPAATQPFAVNSYRQLRWRRGVSVNIQHDLRSIILFLVPNLNFQGGMKISYKFTNIKTNDMENQYHSSFSPSSFTRHNNTHLRPWKGIKLSLSIPSKFFI